MAAVKVVAVSGISQVGRASLARAQVSDVQRARILAAMVRVVAEHGVASATVARVVKRAGVSRRTFYDLFTGCEDCFLAVFEDTVSRASVIATNTATSAPAGWREQVRAGLGALLGFCDEEPLSGSLLVVDALGAGPAVLERRTRILRSLTAIVDEGRGEQAKRGVSSPPPLTAEGTVGAVLAVIHARMLENTTNGPPRPLLELLNPLMAMIVLPYFGRAAATKELARPVPKVRVPKAVRAPSKSADDPLDGLNMRLTYRTLMVLSAVAADPGASNRGVADAAGVQDQGQISKLLGRLERLGLIQNTGSGQPKGEPNAWELTAKGREVEQVLTTGR